MQITSEIRQSLEAFDRKGRVFSSELRIDGTEKPVITGHAAVFNQKSEEIFGIKGMREVIKPGAFSNTIKSADVRALLNHDANFVLGRNKNGTLLLEEDAIGLKVRIFPPDTIFANDILENIKRGDIDQMSFGFRTIEDNWRKQDGETIRELIEVELFDVSPVTFPAYPQTDVHARSFFQAKLSELDESAPEKSLSVAEKIQQRETFLQQISARFKTDNFLERLKADYR